MKRYINYILVFFLVCACANVGTLYGQETQDDRVMVYLKKGSKFEAVLIGWDQESDLMTFNAFNSTLEFPTDEIKKIVHLGVDESGSYNFKESGPYYHIRVNAITGNPGNRSNFEPGIGISVSAGKRFNRRLSVGGGIGFDEYIIGTSENILSSFGEISGYLMPSNQTLSYHLAAGYGFAFKDEDSNLTAASGGWMVYPAIGLRLGKRDMKWTFDFGYKFQRANWVYESWGTVSDQRILYRRLTLRAGVLF